MNLTFNYKCQMKLPLIQMTEELIALFDSEFEFQFKILTIDLELFILRIIVHILQKSC